MTTLTLLGAKEILFTQFNDDYRWNATATGTVGMAQPMHKVVERASIYGNKELKNIGEFPTE